MRRTLRARIGAGLACAALALGPWAVRPSTADVRVLLAFDVDGQRVERVYRDSGPGRLPARPVPKRDTSSVPARGGEGGGATLAWLDRRGRVLSLERRTDPRVGHVPLLSGDEGVTRRVALTEGSWLVRGPDDAVTLVLRLSARAEFALPGAEWRFDLD